MTRPGSVVVKRSVVLSGHRTSVSIEEPFWEALRAIAQERQTSLNGLVASIDAARQGENLSSAIRLAVLAHYRPPAQDAQVQRHGEVG